MNTDVQKKTRTIDDICRKLDAMRAIAQILDTLSEDEQKEVLLWLVDAYAEPSKTSPAMIPRQEKIDPCQSEPSPYVVEPQRYAPRQYEVVLYGCPIDVVASYAAPFGGISSSGLITDHDDLKYKK